MKIDMHCHVKEGSVDSRVGVEEYIELLQEQGFDGMVITDHDTYNGYRYWKNHIKGKKYTDFTVFKGIEYDTRDAGHILVIMPEGVKMRLLEMRGMHASVLIDFVHENGGVLGPAHPCGEKYLSITDTKGYYKDPEVIRRFDFVEEFNACEPPRSNENASKLAKKFQKIGVGGSDAHRPDCVGTAYTILPETATCETELISQIQRKAKIICGGQIYDKTTKDKIGKINKILIYSFWFYNRGGELLKRHRRKIKTRTENPLTPIDPLEVDIVKMMKKKHY